MWRNVLQLDQILHQRVFHLRAWLIGPLLLNQQILSTTQWSWACKCIPWYSSGGVSGSALFFPYHEVTTQIYSTNYYFFFKCDPLLGRDPPIEKRRAKWLGGWCLFPTATTVFLELFCVSSHPFPVFTPRSDFWALVSAEHLVSCSSAELWACAAGNVFRGGRRCFSLWFAVIVTLNSVDPFKVF